jgi:hypothetical protein
MFKRTKRYRPGRYFMRGPGPNWLEKHGGKIDRANVIMHRNHIGKHILTSLCVILREPGAGTSGYGSNWTALRLIRMTRRTLLVLVSLLISLPAHAQGTKPGASRVDPRRG